MMLKCSKCNEERFLDETDDDEIQNAIMEGWDFALVLDMNVLCPKCKDNKDLHEFEGEY